MLLAALRKYVPATKRAAVSSYDVQLISRYEGTRSRYPARAKLSRFGTVSCESNEQAITRLSWYEVEA